MDITDTLFQKDWRMLTEQEAQNLMIQLIDLRKVAEDTKDPSIIRQLKRHENLCLSKFKYLVTMKTGRYKAFSNYDDLNQEGFEALLKSMVNYDPKRGSFFWWAHKYIDTRISRCANLHTTIRYPLKVAKEQTPHKEAIMPTLVEEKKCPDKELESSQITDAIHSVLSYLSDEQKEIVCMAYGINCEKPVSINKICKQKNISRPSCIKAINAALSAMKENIKI